MLRNFALSCFAVLVASGCGSSGDEDGGSNASGGSDGAGAKGAGGAGASGGAGGAGSSVTCGDGTLDPNEDCDDGNTAGGDGCSATCAFEIALAAGIGHSCALRYDRTVKCWGSNRAGQLGLGDLDDRGDGAGEMGANLPIIDLGSGRRAVSFAAAGNHTCALLDDRTVKCWGNNRAGQLGLGDTDDRGDAAGEMGNSLAAVDLGPGRTAVALAAGRFHSCALLDDGSVRCWGDNGEGQLGLGDILSRGDAAGEMGNSLPAIDLGSGRTVTALAPGREHTCALLDDRTVKCWGYNAAGQLGLGDVVNRGDGVGEMGDNLPAVDLGSGRTAIALAAGHFHTCALLDDGSVKCWGDGSDGQLGLGDVSIRGDGVGEMGDSLPAVDLGPGRTAMALVARRAYSCALLDDGSLKCWGSNRAGQLGLGDLLDRGDEAGEMGTGLPSIDLGPGRTVVNVAAGRYHACALLDDRSVKCWGSNRAGQLGLGDVLARGDEAGEMGNNLPAIDLGP